ncbi:MAG: thiamine-phosphate kinase [Gammaproteobacteria bacterium]|nr:thiamine-phosphate kinase [Gammaproteobacteria bacterium]
MAAMGEFDLIKRYFDRPELRPGPVMALGPGDDCALLDLPQNHQLAVTSDTFVCEVHFFADMAANQIAQRCLAASVSDLAAMGAVPAWFNLCLTLPNANPLWINDFSQGLAEQAQACSISLAGGDTTKGPLAISIHAMGWVPMGQAIIRSGAQINDVIMVSGSLGDSAAGLQIMQHQRDAQDLLSQRYWQPTPRIELGLWLRDKATSCLDISDGLVQDLGHIIAASGCGADLQLQSLPLSAALQAHVPLDQAHDYALNGGEDFELCFTLPAHQVAKALAYSQASGLPLTAIGRISSEPGCRVWDKNGALYQAPHGYQHF